MGLGGVLRQSGAQPPVEAHAGLLVGDQQDADLVGLLYKAYSEDGEGGPPDETEGVPVNLLLAKQRNGPTGDVPMVFLKSYTRFESASRVDPGDVPND